jgi:hypothetical protein
MLKRYIVFLRYFIVLIVFSFLYSCKKEHLEPLPLPPSSGSTEPVVYITAKLDSDSVYYAGGLSNYTGIPSYSDSGSSRTFDFTLKNSQLPSQSYFKISINNYTTVLRNPQEDLDSTIYISNRPYTSGTFFFVPLAAAIYWVDANGNQFKSTTTVPNVFSILSVEDIVVESKKYKKTVLQFECYLKYGINNIHLTNGEATVLFSVD